MKFDTRNQNQNKRSKEEEMVQFEDDLKKPLHYSYIYLEDGVLRRKEQVPSLAQRVVHARTGEGSHRLKAPKRAKDTGNGASGNHVRG